MRSARGGVLVTLLAWVGAGLILAGLSSWLWGWPLTLSPAGGPAPTASVGKAPTVIRDAPPWTLAPVVERVAPCVVSVYSTKTVRSPHGIELRPFFDDPFFRRFFGDPFEQLRPRQQKRQSLGSGVIVAADGVILTNSHVVEGATRSGSSCRTGNATSPPGWWAATPGPTSPSSRSTPRGSPPSPLETAIRSGSATSCLRSATPSAWARR